MKKIELYIAAALLFLLLNSCGKEGFMTYSIQDNIYFSGSGISNIEDKDSVGVSFAYSDPAVTEMIVKVPVSVSGAPAKTDRIFKVVADTGTDMTTGQYELPVNAVFRAGMVNDSLLVKFKRTPDMKTKTFTLALKLIPGGDFRTDIQWQPAYSNPAEIRSSLLRYKITISDIFTQGTRWSYYSTYFGTFSVKKIFLIHDLTGAPLNFYLAISPELTASAQLQVWAVSISRYLADQKAAGKTVYEEDGTEMKMGATYQ